jgi:hypothetical protein
LCAETPAAPRLEIRGDPTGVGKPAAPPLVIVLVIVIVLDSGRID